MKLLRSISLFIILFFSFSLFPSPSHAVDPFFPYSIEGNPEEKVYLEEFFPLFRYIRPAQLKVYENRDRSRNYEPLEICKPKESHDRRDTYCDNGETEESDCSGGDVDVCFQSSGALAYTAHSSSGTCHYRKAKKFWVDLEFVDGYCEYFQTPKISGELKATDFSRNDRSISSSQSSLSESSTDTGSTPVSGESKVVYNKVQREDFRYSGIGNDNPVTWGALRLQFNQGEQAVKQLLVLYRAFQTKETLASTGEWPLGWVDWGYITNNGKTLLDIYSSLPPGLKSSAKAIAESEDDFFMTGGNLDIVSDVSRQKEYVYRAITDAALQTPQPAWFIDLLQTPLYSPSFRQGYARTSICVWDKCCPGPECPLEEGVNLIGDPVGLYADISVSQTFGAALDDLLLHHNLEQGVKEFKKLVQGNPLIRFAGSASAQAVPSVIDKRLSQEIADPCLKYVPVFAKFTMGWFGYTMDYAQPPTFLDKDKKCPGWAIWPELTKEKGGALPQSILSKLISLLWGGKQVDDVDPTKLHLITIPDAMGQYISEIENPVFQTRDNLSENEKSNEYNDGISNIVDSTTDTLLGGKGIPVGDSKRRLAYFTCTDPDYSSPQETSIEAYAMGTRIGCHNTGREDTRSSCDPSDADKIGQLTQTIGSKYGIPPKTLEAIFKYEGYVGKMGDGCKEETQYKVMGPFQIAHGTYDLVTCDSERFETADQEINSCGEAGKLSRCSLENSVELAARVLLQKLNAYGYYQGSYACEATKANVSSLALFRAVNAYSGCGSIGGKPYAQFICEYAGNCPTPIPTGGSAVSCDGN